MHNFADDNAITAICDQLAELTKILEAERQLLVEWFRKNEMVVNSDKFQAHATHKLIIDNKEIKQKIQ